MDRTKKHSKIKIKAYHQEVLAFKVIIERFLQIQRKDYLEIMINTDTFVLQITSLMIHIL